MRTLTSKLSPGNLFSCFKDPAGTNAVTPAETSADKSTSKISSKNRLLACLGLRPLSKTVNSSASSSTFEQVSSAVITDKQSPPIKNPRFSNAVSQPELRVNTARFEGSNLQHADLAGNHWQSLQRPAVKRGFIENARTSAKEEETLLTLRFEILKLPTDLSVRCNASLARILNIRHPGRRIDMLDQLLSKIPGRFSEKPTPDTLVMTSFLGVATEMSRKKLDEVTAMQMDLLALRGPGATGYRNLLRDVFARPNSEDRDDFLTQMAQEIKRDSVGGARKSAKEEETLLTLRLEILKLPADLSAQCNASLARILDIRHPERRIIMLERLLSKIPSHFSEKNTPETLVITSFLGVTTEMSREKLDEVTAMRMDLLALRGPRATGYQNLLRDVFARPHSKDRDDFLTQMTLDIKAQLTEQS